MRSSDDKSETTNVLPEIQGLTGRRYKLCNLRWLLAYATKQILLRAKAPPFIITLHMVVILDSILDTIVSLSSMIVVDNYTLWVHGQSRPCDTLRHP